MKVRLDLFVAIGAALAGSACMGDERQQPQVSAGSDIGAGRYLTVVGGCNDCHTAGWNETHGKIPERNRLAGVPVGWQGPWGVTYASNLRLTAASMDEDAWVRMLRTRKDRPPMPWMNLNQMAEADSRAIYRYLKSLGPTGGQMPRGLPPGAAPETPFIPMAPPQEPGRASR